MTHCIVQTSSCHDASDTSFFYFWLLLPIFTHMDKDLLDSDNLLSFQNIRCKICTFLFWFSFYWNAFAVWQLFHICLPKSLRNVSFDMALPSVDSQGTGTPRSVILFEDGGKEWMMDQGGLRVLCWRTMIVRLIKSQLKLCVICYPRPFPKNQWALMQNLQRGVNVIIKPLSIIFEWFWESREVPAKWK